MHFGEKNVHIIFFNLFMVKLVDLFIHLLLFYHTDSLFVRVEFNLARVYKIRRRKRGSGCMPVIIVQFERKHVNDMVA